VICFSFAETLAGNRTRACVILMLWYHCTPTKLVWADRYGTSGDLVLVCSGQIITTTAVFRINRTIHQATKICCDKQKVTSELRTDTAHYTRGADKSLARPGKKQATATKLGTYSTYSPRSSRNFLARCSNWAAIPPFHWLLLCLRVIVI